MQRIHPARRTSPAAAARSDAVDTTTSLPRVIRVWRAARKSSSGAACRRWTLGASAMKDGRAIPSPVRWRTKWMRQRSPGPCVTCLPRTTPTGRDRRGARADSLGGDRPRLDRGGVGPCALSRGGRCGRAGFGCRRALWGLHHRSGRQAAERLRFDLDRSPAVPDRQCAERSTAHERLVVITGLQTAQLPVQRDPAGPPGGLPAQCQRSRLLLCDIRAAGGAGARSAGVPLPPTSRTSPPVSPA